MTEQYPYLRVIELFGGIGACSKALERLDIPYVIADYVEIDKYAVKSFNAMHGTDFEPQDITEWDKDYWCPNCGRCFDTGKFHEDDDEMYEDVCPYCGCYPTEPIKGNIDLIMHGSPCQDFSAAGLGAGGDEGSGTRSSLMYETIRIVEKVKPRIVIWENVKNVLSKKHKHNFDAYLERMESLGYKNHYQVLNAKDYGIPQNRERIFTISILAEYDFDFQFPEKQPLTLRLKDILEPQVDESFYLSDVQVGKIKMSTYNQNRTRIQEGDVAQTLCARDWKDPKCVKVGDLDMKGHESMKRVYSADGISPTLTTMGGGNTEPKIIDPQGRLNKVNTPKDYAPTLRAQDHGNPPMAIVDDTYANRDARVYEEYSPALRSERSGLKVAEPFIAASRGRNPENPSDRTVGAPTEQRLEPKFDGTTNTITSVQKDNYVVEPQSALVQPVDRDYKKHGGVRETQVEVKSDGTSHALRTNGETLVAEPKGFVEGAYQEFVDKHGYVPEKFNPYNQAEVEDVAPTQTTQCGSTTSSSAVLLKEDLKDIKLPGAYGRKFGSRGKIQDMEGHSCTLLADMGTGGGNVPLVTPNYRVRKLTPKECWRLMGFDDADYEKAAKENSKTQLYKQAGNSIVVDVLENIFKKLLK